MGEGSTEDTIIINEIKLEYNLMLGDATTIS